MSTEDSQGGENRFRRSPTGPAIAPPRMPAAQAPPPPVQPPRRRRQFWSVAIFILLVSGIVIRAYRDLSQPDAWDYWKDQYVSPGLTSQVIDTLPLDGSSQGRGRHQSKTKQGDKDPFNHSYLLQCFEELNARPEPS